MKLQPGTSLLEVKLSGRGLGDEQMTDLGRYLGQILPDPDPNMVEEAVWANVELAENNIGNAGLISVLDALDRHRVACKVIKLYRNKICDEGGVRLAEMLRRQQSAVDEIHLSHNMFSARSLVALCMALAKHEGYPAVGRNRLYIPCWVRMEYNSISRPQEVLDMLRQNGPIAICTADNRDDCGPWRCACSNKDKKAVPKVHLFTITNQSRRIHPHEDSDLHAEIRRWGGVIQPLAPSVRKPPPTLPAGRSVPPKAGANCTTPTASVANAPPRVNPWDLGGGLPRSITAPAAVGGANSEDESGRSAKNSDNHGDDQGKAAEGANSDFCLSDKEESPKREASEPDCFDPPLRKTPPAPENESKPPSEAAAEALLKRLQGNEAGTATRKENAAGALAQNTGGGTGENTSNLRKSLVLDGGGRRRIHPKQLVEADNSGPFICPLCAFVIARPVITSCSHLFCENCFRSWVGDQVSNQKKNQAPGAPVPLIPCPQSVQSPCAGKLRKQDIMQLDKADATKVGAVALLIRLKNNLRVRCVHHADHFKYSFGKDSELVSRESGTTCDWIGDLMAYDNHVATGCQVETRVAEKFSAKENGTRTGGPASPAGMPNSAAVGPTPNEVKAPLAQKGAVEPRTNGPAGNEAASDAIKPAFKDGYISAAGDVGEVRVAQYDYVPRESDKAQIPLRRHDFVRVFEITDSGWAAGVRLSRETMQEVGDAGWFPEGYLFPLTANR